MLPVPEILGIVALNIPEPLAASLEDQARLTRIDVCPSQYMQLYYKWPCDVYLDDL